MRTSTPLGAFKIRGGLVYVEELKRREPQVAGLIAATRGNHGQSIAFAAKRAGLRAVIVVPHGNSLEEECRDALARCRADECGDDFQECIQSRRRFGEGGAVALGAVIRFRAASRRCQLCPGTLSSACRIWTPSTSQSD